MSVELIDFLRTHFPHFDAVPDDCVITGGPVRDALLGLRPADLDVAVLDAPAAAQRFARATRGHHITLGTRFRTERVVARGRIYDFSPIQGSSIEDDLGRRDFTINAMALRLDGTLIDPFDGRRDLSDGTVRMVRESNLTDDALRIVRAPRMSGAFGFDVDRETVDACRRHRALLSKIPAERITWELRLILESAHPRRAADDMRTIELDQVTLGFALTEDDIDGWERLSSIGKPSPAAIPVIVLLLAGRTSKRDWFLETWKWRREEVREIESTLRILDAVSSDDRPLLLGAAEEGRRSTERAAAVLDGGITNGRRSAARGQFSDANLHRSTFLPFSMETRSERSPVPRALISAGSSVCCGKSRSLARSGRRKKRVRQSADW